MLPNTLFSLVVISVWIAGSTGQQVYLSLGSTTITINNTEVLITDIGEDIDGGLPSLTCHTDLTECCRDSDTGGQGGLGAWYYPDGRALMNNAGSMAAGEGFYFVRNGPQVIRMRRRDSNNPLSPTGSYCCVIPTTGGEMTFCANIVVCPSLPPLTNGMISYSDPTLGVGSVATHSCYTVYTLNEEDTQACQMDSDASGSGADPTCVFTETNTRICGADGMWSGSTPNCVAINCPIGTYLESLSSGEITCVPCPGNSFSATPNSRECSCFSGYYRTELDRPNSPCSAPPSSCRDLQVVEQRTRANTITVHWERPEITGRDDFYYNIFYSEDNQTFTQHNIRPYTKRDLFVDYSVSGLRSLTNYTIRVTAENGVSGQEEGGETRSCEVAGRTGDIRSNAPSLVVGFCSVVVWTTPTRAYGRIIGYDIRFLSPGSNDIVITTSGHRQLFHAIRDELTSTDSVMVQHMSQPIWMYRKILSSLNLTPIYASTEVVYDEIDPSSSIKVKTGYNITHNEAYMTTVREQGVAGEEIPSGGAPVAETDSGAQ